MRSTMITVAAVVAGIFLAAPMATADDVQEQLRLMEQRMAEMEDRLQATSDELNTAKATVAEQQNVLSDAGLAEDEGVRSGVGNFLKAVDVSGVVAASYNYRFLDSGDDNLVGGNVGYFRHPDANTFALDQLWLTVDKAVTEESRAGFHADYVFGKTGLVQGGNSSRAATDYENSGLLYTGYLSYLAPIGNGIQIDAGKLATPLGAETVKANDNFNITQGLVFGLQPVTHVGIQASTAINDNISLTVGVVNDVYNQQNFDASHDKAGYAQIGISTDMVGLNIGAIVGSNAGGGATCTGIAGDGDDDCNISVFDVVLSIDPTDRLSAWVNFDWVRTFGDKAIEGDAYGIAGAWRFGITDSTGFAMRTEYIRREPSFNSAATATGAGPGFGSTTTTTLGTLTEILSLTSTIDHALTDDLKLRLEARWDRSLDNTDGIFFNGNNGANNIAGAGTRLNPSRDDQVVGLAELYYEF